VVKLVDAPDSKDCAAIAEYPQLQTIGIGRFLPFLATSHLRLLARFYALQVGDRAKS